MIRFIIVAITVIGFLILSIPILLIEWIIGKFSPRAKEISSLRIVQGVFKFILWEAGTKVTIIGEENVPKDTPVLYIVGNDDMPFYSMEVMMPFSHVVEARGITEDSVYYFHTDLEQLSTSMVDSNEIEVRAAVSLNVLVIQCREEKIIESVEEQPLDTEKIRSMPGITVYMVKQGDTLWDIAKKFYTTMEEIISMNSLENDRVTLGQPLLLVKKVES